MKTKNTDTFILAIHCTNDQFGFGFRKINYTNNCQEIFTKKFDKNLTNNLIVDLDKFLHPKSFNSIRRICVSLGPANFNATRLMIVLARTISQQINCSLDAYSSFLLMAKRIAIQNNIISDSNQSFWIQNKLKQRGYICGKYQIITNKKNPLKNNIKELIQPNLFKELPREGLHFDVDYNITNDLEELLDYSLINHNNSVQNRWEDVFPIYPISATN